MKNIKMLFEYTLEVLNQKSVKYEFRQFPSGAIMLDIWYGEKFYVIQFENCIGVSEISDENASFDTNPDEKFFSESQYIEKLKHILS